MGKKVHINIVRGVFFGDPNEKKKWKPKSDA